MDFMTATPVEVDTHLADLYYKAHGIGRDITMQMSSVYHYAGAKRVYGRGRGGYNMTASEAWAKVVSDLEEGVTPSWDRRSVERVVAKVTELREALRANHDAQAEIGEAFRARGGWTRAFLVTDGHVHSSMDCSTCNNGVEPTHFDWLPEFSGHDEAEIVAAAADRACTVCYPTAPVATAGKSTLLTRDERAAAEKREQAARDKAERLAKRVAKGLTADGSEFVVSYPDTRVDWVRNGDGTTTRTEREIVKRESFKTEQAAVQWVVQYKAWNPDGMYDNRKPAFDAIVEAVAAKHGKTVAEVEAEIEKKVAAKIKRDSR